MKSLRSIFFVILVISLSSIVYADNSFIFSTDPQSVAVGVMSGKINIQSASPVTETTYLTLTSSSPTGQFLTSSGNPQTASVYIATGDSNRAVYYEDSTAGVFTLTATILNKSKVQIASISQQIFIGQPVSNTNSGGSNNATSTDSTSDSTDTSTNSPSSNLSAHSSPTPLSSADQTVDFQISAGRDRLTSVGNLLTFKVTPTVLQNVANDNIVYMWSFGDGTTGQGSTVSHSYAFAGIYSVVVDGVFSDDEAVSRLSVTVIDPKISLNSVSGGVQIGNNSSAEINLEGWHLSGGEKSFTFPKDTLIPSGQKVIFSNNTTGIFTGTVELINPLGTSYASIAQNSVIASTTSQIATSSLDAITAQIQNVKNNLALLMPKVQSISPTSPQISSQNTVAVGQTKHSSTQENKPVQIQTNQTANVVTVFQASSSPSFLGSIFSLPMKGINFIKNFFIEK